MKENAKRADGFVPLSQKLNYSIGSGGGNIITTIAGSFVAAYLTDSVGIGAATMSTMILVNRAFDLLTDFAMGSIVDRTRTKWGKARPWVAISAPLIAILLILVFSVPESLGSTGKLIYVYITYLFLNAIGFTMFFIPHTALLSRMTLNGNERQKIASMEQILNQVAGLAVTTFWVPLTTSVGYRSTAIIYGVATCVFILFAFFGTKETVGENDEKKPETKSDVPFKTQLSCLAKNKYFWLETCFFALLLLHNCGCGMVSYYYCNIVLGNASLVAVISACSMIPAMAMNLILPSIVKKIGKRRIMIISSCVVIATGVLMGLNPTAVGLVCVLYGIKGFFMGSMFSCAFALTGDVVDYGEWKFGVRSEGLVMSGVSIGQKAGLGLGPAIAGWILAFGGYDGLAEVQTASAVASINFTFTYYAAICGVILLVVSLLFDVDKHTSQMQADLTKKHSLG